MNNSIAVDQISALEAKAKARKLDEQEKRRLVWLRIQQDAPMLAAFLGDFEKAFGKPGKIKIELSGEVVVNR